MGRGVAAAEGLGDVLHESMGAVAVGRTGTFRRHRGSPGLGELLFPVCGSPRVNRGAGAVLAHSDLDQRRGIH